MLPLLPGRSETGIFGTYGDGRSRELTDLHRRRREAVAQGDSDAVDELNAAILSLVETAVSAYAADLKLQANEQAKISSNFVNAMAVTVFSGEVAAPVFGIFAPGSPYAANTLLLGEVSGGCFMTAVVIHFIARRILRSLRS